APPTRSLSLPGQQGLRRCCRVSRGMSGPRLPRANLRTLSCSRIRPMPRATQAASRSQARKQAALLSSRLPWSHPEVSLLKLRIGSEFGRGACHGDPAIFEDVGAPGKFERLHCVLLDKHDGKSVAGDVADQRKELFDG